MTWSTLLFLNHFLQWGSRLDWARIRRGSQWEMTVTLQVTCDSGLAPVQGGCYWSHRRVSHEGQDIETFQHLWRKTSGSRNLYLNRICNIFNQF